MQTAIKINTRVLAGSRVEFTSPELVEGEYLELIVLKNANSEPARPYISMLDIAAKLHKDRSAEDSYALKTEGVWDWMQSLPPSTLTAEDWVRIEKEIQEEKDSWDR